MDSYTTDQYSAQYNTLIDLFSKAANVSYVLSKSKGSGLGCQKRLKKS
jgi:hypothetical protein